MTTEVKGCQEQWPRLYERKNPLRASCLYITNDKESVEAIDTVYNILILSM